MPPVTGASSLWQRAEAELTPKERQQLAKVQSNNAASIFESTRDLLEASTSAFRDKSLAVTLPGDLRGGKRKLYLRDIFRRAVAWLKIATSVGDKVIQFDTSGHAALPWAAVKLLVELVAGDVQKYDSVIDGIGTIVHNLTFYEEWQRLYADRSGQSNALPLFENALVRLYASILRYQVATLQYVEQNRLVRIGKGMSSALLPSSKFQDQLNALSEAEDEASKIARLLDADLLRQMSAGIDSLADHLRDLQASHEKSNVGILKAVEAGMRPVHDVVNYIDSYHTVAILNWFSDAPFQVTHNKVHDRVVPDTGAWLLGHDKFQDWKSSAGSSTLWLHGTMGMGKTSLASIVIDHLENTETKADAASKIAFYYFVRDTGRTSSGEALAAVARQFATSTSASQLLTRAQEVHDGYLSKGVINARELGDKHLQRMVADLAGQYSTVWIVMDALDESDDGAEIFDATQAILNLSPSRMKIFMTSREATPENPGLADLYAQVPHLSIRDGLLSGDIAAFIDFRMNELIKKKKLLGGIASSKDKTEVTGKLRQSILDHANGMFRWAEMRLVELCGTKYRLKSSVLKTIDQVPQALSELYDGIFHALSENGPTPESRLARAAISWLVYSRTPIETSQLMQALWYYCKPELEQDEVNLELVQALLPEFFTEVVFPTNGLTVLEFAHLSVREHFERHAELCSKTCHAAIALSCLRRLETYAVDFDDRSLPTVLARASLNDPASSRTGRGKEGNAVNDKASICGSLIIGRFPEETLAELIRARRKHRQRRLARRQAQQASTIIEIQPMSSSASSSASDESGLSELEALDGAPFALIRSESDILMEAWDSDEVDDDEHKGDSDEEGSNGWRSQDNRTLDIDSIFDCVRGLMDGIPDRSMPQSDPNTPNQDPPGLQSSVFHGFFPSEPRFDHAQHDWDSRQQDTHPQNDDIDDGVFGDGAGGGGNDDYDDDDDYADRLRQQRKAAREACGIDNYATSSDGSEQFQKLEDELPDDWDRYPLIAGQRRRLLEDLHQGKISLGELQSRLHNVLREPFLRYARLHWHFHLAKCAHDPSTMVYDEDELQVAFEAFSNVGATEEGEVLVDRDRGLAFVLWYDWMRQDEHFRDHDLEPAFCRKPFMRKRSPRDRWVVRLKRVYDLAGIQPGSHLADRKVREVRAEE